MRVAILQPGYLPWLGYFEQMAAVDLFVSLDDVRYTKQDWRNRNRIRSNQARGWSWLTVPVNRHTTDGLIQEVAIRPAQEWWPRHLRLLDQHYGHSRTAHYAPLRQGLVEAVAQGHRLLVDLDLALSEVLARCLEVTTPVVRASQLRADGKVPDGVAPGDRSGRLLALCQGVGATSLYDGQSAREFLDVPRLEAAGVSVTFQDYQHPEYTQSYPGPFVTHLSAVDLIACCGPRAPTLMRKGGGGDAGEARQ